MSLRQFKRPDFTVLTGKLGWGIAMVVPDVVWTKAWLPC